MGITVPLIQLNGFSALLLGSFLETFSGGGDAQVISGFCIGWVESDCTAQDLNRIVILFLLDQSDSEDGVGKRITGRDADRLAKRLLCLWILLLLESDDTQIGKRINRLRVFHQDFFVSCSRLIELFLIIKRGGLSGCLLKLIWNTGFF